MREMSERLRLFLRLRLWARRVNLPRKLTVALTLGVILSGMATYAALTNARPLGGALNPKIVLVLLVLDLLLVLLLLGLVMRRVARVWAERRSGGAGAKLHIRLVLMFSVVSVAPAILVAVFSTLLIHFGVEQWFNSRVSTAVNESLVVANAYLEEHQQAIGGDALAMAYDLDRWGPALLHSPIRLEQVISSQAEIRALPEVVVFVRGSGIIASSALSFSMTAAIEHIPVWAYQQAQNGKVAIIIVPGDDKVRALVRLDDPLSETYLFVGRFVDPKVLGHVTRTTQAVEEYQRLEGARSHLEIKFSAIFAVVALLLLLAAVWVGLSLATQLASPIIALIDAAERIRVGDLSARVDASAASDELRSLSRAFNRMASQLGAQRHDLMTVNRELDERRRFTETVLSGVSAGVIGLDVNGAIELPNRSATELLGMEAQDLSGRSLGEAVPEMADLLDTVRNRPERPVQSEIVLRREGRQRTLLVRISAERDESETVTGFVATFDDMSELASAQRKAAWADVARRIAHEIKNPLTPIQLSAERLKRKYLKQISTDPETFITCTDTIIRQVGDIGRMVDEFSSFARMPAPVMKHENLGDLVRQAVFLARNGYPAVGFESHLPEAAVTLPCDGRQIGQALTNLLKNAVEAIEGRGGDGLEPGRIAVTLRETAGEIVVSIEDNGKGLPVEERDRLTEPYVTTRAKGTGLGLAIVRKIMEDHGGELVLEDRAALDGATGARISMVFRPGDRPAGPQGNVVNTVSDHGA